MKFIKKLLKIIVIFFVIVIVLGIIFGDNKKNKKSFEEHAKKSYDNVTNGLSYGNEKINPLIQEFIDVKEDMSASQVRDIVKNNKHVKMYDSNGKEVTDVTDIKEMDVMPTDESEPCIVVYFDNGKVRSKKYSKDLTNYSFIHYKGVKGVNTYESAVMYKGKDDKQVQKLATDKKPSEIEQITIEKFNN